MAKKIRIYISGPITNDKEHYEANFKKAADLVNNKEELGFRVNEAVNPLDLEPEYTDETKWTDKVWLECIKKDLDLLSTCDAMAMLPGWDYSAGCITEYIAARKLGIPIMALYDVFGVEVDDDRHKDEFPTFHARFIRDAIREFKNLKPVEESWRTYKDKLKAAVEDALKEERANDKGNFIIKFTNTGLYSNSDVEYLSSIDTDGVVQWRDDVAYALHMGSYEANRSLKILKLVKEKDKYKWNVEIISYSSKYSIRYWDDKEHQWMYLEQSKCGYKIGMFNFDRDKAERFTYEDANKEVLRIRSYDEKFGKSLHIVDATDNTEGCLDCPPIEEDSTEPRVIECKYAIRYWDVEDSKWKYYRFGGGFGDKEDCQKYTYTDAKKVLAFSTTKLKLEIADTTIEDTCESEYLKEKDKLDRLAGDAKNYNKQKKLVDKLHKQMAEKEEASDGFIILSYNRDRSCKRYLSLFDKANKSYKFSIFIKEAIVFPSRAKALKAYHAVKKIKDNDSKAWISKLDVLTVARKSDVLKWNHYEEGKIGNYVLAYFGPDSKLRYIRSVRNKSCWATEDIKEAESFTKVGAIQALEKILQADMVNFKNVQIEPFIVSLAKMEEK